MSSDVTSNKNICDATGCSNIASSSTRLNAEQDRTLLFHFCESCIIKFNEDKNNLARKMNQ